MNTESSPNKRKAEAASPDEPEAKKTGEVEEPIAKVASKIDIEKTEIPAGEVAKESTVGA